MLPDVLILGAGMAGLSAATALEARGATVQVLDKGRGYGGRLSTRRFENALRFDHGAQYFTARSPEFQEQVAEWQARGLVREWFTRLHADEPHPRPRYIPTPELGGMNRLPRAMAEALNAEVQRSERVVQIAREHDAWVAHCEGGNRYHGRELLLTLPLPQTLALLEASALHLSPKDAEALNAVRYAPSLVLMLQVKAGALAPDAPEFMAMPEAHAVSWVADNLRKYQQNVAGVGAALTVHSSAAFAAAHFEKAPEALYPELLAALGPYASVQADDVLAWQFHRWRYALVETPLDCGGAYTLESSGGALTFAGDAFGAFAKVEAAWASGRIAAQRLTV